MLIHFDYGVQKLPKNLIFNFVCIFILFFLSLLIFILVNDGDYLNAVSEQSLAENVTRVLYPNDNVNIVYYLIFNNILFYYLVYARKRTSS